MGENSSISWTDHTFSPWHGCVEVSPACTNCYARTFDARFFGGDGKEPAHWGKDAPRRFFGEKHWADPLKWNRNAVKLRELGTMPRMLVFCASMADVFERYNPGADDGIGALDPGMDNTEPVDPLDAVRARLWALIRATPALTWLLLTKRPQNIGRMLAPDLVGAQNIWLGTTIESPDYLWRADALIKHGARAPVRFVSMEPLIAETSIAWKLEGGVTYEGGVRNGPGINWVLIGTESGDGSRATPSDWYRRLITECRAHGVPALLKQAKRGADGITVGNGSRVKLRDNLVELPYLDGRQHANFPPLVPR